MWTSSQSPIKLEKIFFLRGCDLQRTKFKDVPASDLKIWMSNRSQTILPKEREFFLGVSLKKAHMFASTRVK